MKDVNKVLCRLTNNMVGQISVEGDVEQWEKDNENKSITVIRKGVPVQGDLLNVVAWLSPVES